MAGLGLMGHLAAGAVGGVVNGALKEIEENRKQGFERLKYQLQTQANSQNNKQKYDYDTKIQAQRAADGLANTKLQQEGLMARDAANNNAAMARDKANHMAAMGLEKYRVANRATKPARDYMQEAQLKAWQADTAARLDNDLEPQSWPKFQQSMVESSKLAEPWIERFNSAKTEQERQMVLDAAANALPQDARDMVEAYGMAWEANESRELRDGLASGVNNPTFSPFTYPSKPERLFGGIANGLME